MARIRLEHVSLRFPVYGSLSLRGWVAQWLRKRYVSPPYCRCVSALEDITEEFDHGSRVGLLGRNGSGKSTFLRLLAGIYAPTSGKVTVQGRVGTLFDLSLGMDEEATGYENIYISGALLGFRASEIRNIIPDIETFTELGEALCRPVKTYSAGMRVRLAFALATAVQADIMLIDEIVGVGDMRFLGKASERAKTLCSGSKMLFLASHAEFVLRDFCTEGIVFHEGYIVKRAPIDEAIAYYNENIGGVVG